MKVTKLLTGKTIWFSKSKVLSFMFWPIRICVTLNLYHTITYFYDSEENAFSPFPTIFSTPIINRNYHFSNIQVVVCKCFQLGPDKNFVIW